jgi:hypothetical protein
MAHTSLVVSFSIREREAMMLTVVTGSWQKTEYLLKTPSMGLCMFGKTKMPFA